MGMSAYPYVAAEASMYGSFKYEKSGGDFAITDALFDAHKVKNIQCEDLPKPQEKNNFSHKLTKSESKFEPFSIDGAEVPGTCFAAAIALRAGVEFDLGFFPKSVSSTDELKGVLKENICDAGKHALGFIKAADTALKLAGMERVSECLGLQDGALVKMTKEALIEKFKPACYHMVDMLFSLGTAQITKGLNVAVPEYCDDIKFYTSDVCKDKVGCGAKFDLLDISVKKAKQIEDVFQKKPGNLRRRLGKHA